MTPITFRKAFRMTADADDVGSVDRMVIEKLEQLNQLSGHHAQEWMRNAMREKFKRDSDFAKCAAGGSVNEG